MVDINKVYQRVLLLANKEQRGYITPDEFNSFAELAQLEIFEDYVGIKVSTSGITDTSDEYGDVSKLVEERLTYFDNVTSITRGDILEAESTARIEAALAMDPVPDVIEEQYMSPLANNVNGFAYPTDFFLLGMVQVNSRDFPVMADEVSHRDLSFINLSPLTRPTAKQPVYTRHEGGVVVYPNTVEDISMIYLRKPVQPKWGYQFLQADMTLGPDPDPMADNQEPMYDSNLSTQFELHPGEEDSLTYRILALAGVAIKQPDITGFGQQNQQ